MTVASKAPMFAIQHRFSKLYLLNKKGVPHLYSERSAAENAIQRGILPHFVKSSDYEIAEVVLQQRFP